MRSVAAFRVRKCRCPSLNSHGGRGKWRKSVRQRYRILQSSSQTRPPETRYRRLSLVKRAVAVAYVVRIGREEGRRDTATTAMSIAGRLPQSVPNTRRLVESSGLSLLWRESSIHRLYPRTSPAAGNACVEGVQSFRSAHRPHHDEGWRAEACV